VIDVLDTRYSLGDTIDSTLYESEDSYAISRSVYLQNRRFFLEGGATTDYVDPYEELYGE
jgi:phospholipid-binding lipoprotein MlaA